MLAIFRQLPRSRGFRQGQATLLAGIRMAEYATASDVEAKLKDKLQATHADVVDTSGGCGASFSVSIASPQFEGKSLLARHRMINLALAKEMEQLHALSIRKAQSTKEYEAENHY